jgi:hypothetical protein
MTICPDHRMNGDHRGVVNSDAVSNCRNCTEEHVSQLTSIGCGGAELWRDYCAGEGSGRGLAGIQVFSDLPIIELYHLRVTCIPTAIPDLTEDSLRF